MKQHCKAVVAIPARNEETHLPACLEALDQQTDGRASDIVVFLNNCTDRSASILNDLRRRLATPLHVIAAHLPADQANAGTARQLALAAALRIAGDNGVLLTTDADSRVDPDWIGANLAALQAGADAVAGWVELDPADWGKIPLRLHEDDARECAYDALCDELHALLDPDPSDPLPRHTQASGASIAVTVPAYRAAGGMPPLASGEDRAFIAALRRIDAKIRHSPACRVVVSGRTVGRASNGMADTIKRRLEQPDLYLDERLEPAANCARRAALRRLARFVFEAPEAAGQWWRQYAVNRETAIKILDHQTFGAAWASLEEISPVLTRQRVAVVELPRQQAIAADLLAFAGRDPIACRRALRSDPPDRAQERSGLVVFE